MILIRQRKAKGFSLVLVFTFVPFFLQACATPKSSLQRYTKTYIKRDMSDMSMLSPLKVVRYQTPDIKVIPLGRVLTVVTVGTLLTAGVGAAIAGASGAHAGAAASGVGGGFLTGLIEKEIKKRIRFRILGS
jgi:methyl coenzyme M reductase alpha subunit